MGEGTTKPKWSWLWRTELALGIFLILFFVGGALFPRHAALGVAKKAQARTMCDQFAIACTLYKTEYDRIPLFTENVKLHRLFDGKNIDGANPRRIQFFSFNQRDLNDQDEVCDPWKTPFRFALDDKGLIVTSAGPDRQFGTKDDITNRDLH